MTSLDGRNPDSQLVLSQTEMGPLVTAQHLAKVKGYVDQGEKEGARSSSTAAVQGAAGVRGLLFHRRHAAR